MHITQPITACSHSADIRYHEQFLPVPVQPTGTPEHQNTNTKPSEHMDARRCWMPIHTCLSTIASLVVCCTSVLLCSPVLAGASHTACKPASLLVTYWPVAQHGSCFAESAVFSERLPRVLPDTGELLARQQCTEYRACMRAQGLHDERTSPFTTTKETQILILEVSVPVHFDCACSLVSFLITDSSDCTGYWGSIWPGIAQSV